MKVKEVKGLKWGEYIKPSEQHRQTFRTGKRIESGIFLGVDKNGLMRVVTYGSGTIDHYHPHFWEKL